MSTGMYPGQEQQIATSFTRMRIIQTILYILMIICVSFAIFSWRHISDITLTGMPSSLEIGISSALFVVLVIITYFHWRCPSCHKFLGFNTSIRSCPKCKVQLRKNDYDH